MYVLCPTLISHRVFDTSYLCLNFFFFGSEGLLSRRPNLNDFELFRFFVFTFHSLANFDSWIFFLGRAPESAPDAR